MPLSMTGGMAAPGSIADDGSGLLRAAGVCAAAARARQHERGGKGDDPEGAHTTRTSRNMPISMW